MSTFNQNFFQPNREYTREMAESRLAEKGFSGFTYTGCSFSNGASFYFDGANGEKIRVSDHALTGSRAFDVIQVRFEEPEPPGTPPASPSTWPGYLFSPWLHGEDSLSFIQERVRGYFGWWGGGEPP